MSDIYDIPAEPQRFPFTIHRYYVVRNGKPVLVTVTGDPNRDVPGEQPFKTQGVLMVSAPIARRNGVTSNYFYVEAGAGLGVHAQVDAGALRVVAVDAEGVQTTIVILGPGYWSECFPADQEMADNLADVLAGLG